MLFALELEERDRMSLAALPIDKLHWTYINAKRDPGETDKDGNVIRPPAPLVELEAVRTFSNRRSNLASKLDTDPDWDYSLQGAKANREKFEAWAGVKARVQFIPTKP